MWHLFGHVFNNHIDKVNRPTKSKFATNDTEEVKGLIRQTVKKENLTEMQGGGKKVYKNEFSEPTGTRGETGVEVVTKPGPAGVETIVTARPSFVNTSMTALGIASFIGPALSIYNFSVGFAKENGRDPTWSETARFLATGDSRSDDKIMRELLTCNPGSL